MHKRKLITKSPYICNTLELQRIPECNWILLYQGMMTEEF